MNSRLLAKVAAPIRPVTGMPTISATHRVVVCSGQLSEPLNDPRLEIIECAEGGVVRFGP